MMRFFILAVLTQLWASAGATPPPKLSSENSASLELMRQEHHGTGLVNSTLLNLESNTALNASKYNRFSDPYDYAVADSPLTIRFFGYQGTVNLADLDNCVRKVNRDTDHEAMTGEAQASMGADSYVWSAGLVTLDLIAGEQLTWPKWSVAPIVIWRFVLANGLKGTQFILLWHGIGPVGYGQLSAASETAHSSMTATAMNAFPDPHDRQFDSMTVEFYGYRGHVSATGMRDVVEAATNEFIEHILESRDPMTVTAPSYTYLAGGVSLFLRPTEDLTWQMWAFVPIRLQAFVTENEYKGTQFILLWEGLGPVGYGELLSTSTNVLSAPKPHVS